MNPIGTAVDTPEEVWNYVISVNLTGAFLCCKYVLPHMLKQGGGVIFNVGSVNSFITFENEVAYDASKGEVLMLTKATALDFAKRNIRVNCICPSIIKTPRVQEISDESDESTIDAIRKKHPMNRLGLPEEVAKVALFLASDDSSFITGEAIAVDGGILAGQCDWPSEGSWQVVR